MTSHMIDPEDVLKVVYATRKTLTDIEASLEDGISIAALVPAVLLFSVFKEGGITKVEMKQAAISMSVAFMSHIEGMLREDEKQAKLH